MLMEFGVTHGQFNPPKLDDKTLGLGQATSIKILRLVKQPNSVITLGRGPQQSPKSAMAVSLLLVEKIYPSKCAIFKATPEIQRIAFGENLCNSKAIQRRFFLQNSNMKFLVKLSVCFSTIYKKSLGHGNLAVQVVVYNYRQ